MPKFRKKPVVVDALQFAEDGSNWIEIHQFIKQQCSVWIQQPAWYVDIPTLEGMRSAKRGDWIIRGEKGEFYPIKDTIFREDHEPDEPSVPASSISGRDSLLKEYEASGETGSLSFCGWLVKQVMETRASSIPQTKAEVPK